MSTNDVHQHLQDPDTWKRVGLIVFFGIIYFFAQYLIFALAIIQLAFKAFTGRTQPALARFCDDLSRYIYRTLRYCLWTSDEMPYPLEGSSDQSASGPQPVSLSTEGEAKAS